MKKVHIVVLSGKKSDSSNDLKELGLVHVTERHVQAPSIEQIQTKQNQYRKGLVYLASVEGKKVSVPPASGKAAEVVLEAVTALGEQIKNLEEGLDKALKEEQRISMLGNFDPQEFRLLSEGGVPAILWTLPTSDLAKVSREVPWTLCKAAKARCWIVVWGDAELPASAEQFALPEASLAVVQAQIAELRRAMDEAKAGLLAHLGEKQSLEAAIAALDIELEQAVVEASMDEDGPIALLEGFIPAEKSADLMAWGRTKGWGVVVTDPGPDDRVPTLLRNPKPVRMLKPILGFLGTTPGYQERDISHWFLMFLTLFFAMIIGDAMYGAILLLIGIVAAVKIKAAGRKLPEFIPLLLTFSIATMAWGAVTGTWLGLASIADIPVLKQLQVPFLMGKIDARTLYNPAAASAWAGEAEGLVAQKNIMLICFVIGLGHLLLAHILRFFRELGKAPHIHAFAQLGWASVLFGAFWLVLSLVLDARAYPTPDWAIWFIGGGMGMVFLFEQQQGDNFFKGVLRALGNFITTALSGVSAFADIISYIRLFAVGLAGVAISVSFNSMAQGAFEGGGLGLVTGGLIMFFGHTLNLMMGALSVVVHGVRLNMLEYSGHIGLEWTGFNYKPFSKAS